MNGLKLKPFHESIIDELDQCLDLFHSYARPGGLLSSQPVLLLIKDLGGVVRLILSTKIPEDKINDTRDAIKAAFDRIIDIIKKNGYRKSDVLQIKNLFIKIDDNLVERIKL